MHLPLALGSRLTDVHLQTGIRSATSRIVLASLYLGSDDKERQLVADLRTALLHNPHLHVHILLDFLRGTRGYPDGSSSSSASLLEPLVREFGVERVRVSLYHTPELSGWRKRWIPERYNEGIGVTHIKAYVFDDDVLLSGYALIRGGDWAHVC